ncbi:MAG: AAA family ATPase [Ktedonobacteraceae bacterium]|nr:AAA family ATPase [Ktedonobacteraceae bacterium]
MKQGRTHQEPRLSGRQQELALLWNQFEESAAGQLRVVLVAGEPGIGKTRLLDEMAGRVEQSGALILRGGASQAEGMPPYLPFLEALGQYIRGAAQQVLREQTGAFASVLSTLLPELPLRLETMPESYPLPPEQARLRLYEAIGAFLVALTASQPLLLVLDDLQWADPATLDLLSHVARHQPRARLLVLGAYREGEVIQHSAFERMLVELTRIRQLSTFKLGPLIAGELVELAGRMLGASLDSAAGELLVAQSECNPFLAEELLQDWLETGTLTLVNSCYCLVSSVHFHSSLPSSIVNAVGQRLGRLSLECADLLRTAAIIGRTFDGALLAQVVSQEAEAVEERLQEAVVARLIRSDQPGTFMFSHDTIRACLYAEVGSVRRTRLHTLIGHILQQKLEYTKATLGTRLLASLAFHFARSGERELGALYSRQAGASALRSFASEEALAYYRTARSLLDESASQYGPCLLDLGEAAQIAGVFQEAIEAFASALQWWRTGGNSEEEGRAALGLGRAYWRREEIVLARTALQQAVVLLSEKPSVQLVQALIELGSLQVLSLHEFVEARDFLDQALALARQYGDGHLEAAASRALGSLVLRRGDAEGAICLLEQALVKAEEIDDVWEATEICASLSLAYRWSGAFDRQQGVLQRWLTYAQRCHDPYQQRHLYSFLATGYALRGQRAEAEDTLAQGQRIVEQLDSPEPLAMLQFTRGSLAGIWGDLDMSEELLRSSIARFRELEPHSLVWWLGGLGFVLALKGKRREALATLEELEVLISPLPESAMSRAHVLCFMGAIAVWLEDRDWAVQLAPRLEPFQGQMHAFSMDRLSGALATLVGDFSTARAHLMAAKEATQRTSFKVELAATLVAQAELELAEHGRPGVASARVLLEEAAALSAQIGFQTCERHVRERLRQLAGKGTRPHLPARLSPREADVLRLIAQGKSNREIAEALVISERTVASHLANIFNKSGVENRTAAAAFAIRHELAE